MLKVADLVPVADGLKVTWKVVEPVVAATGLVALAVTVKSAALVPPTAIIGVPLKASSAEPVFLMVKVLTTVPLAVSAEPKSVWSDVEGLESPSVISVELPSMLISGAGSPFSHTLLA